MLWGVSKSYRSATIEPKLTEMGELQPQVQEVRRVESDISAFFFQPHK
jgi:hypothetical protein